MIPSRLLTISLAAIVFAGSLFTSGQILQANDDINILVVTNKVVELQSIDDNEIRRLFLGKSRRLPNGDRAALAAFEPLKTVFNTQVLGEPDNRVARIWSKLKFSGRQPPPRTFSTVDEIVEYVKSTRNALAYLPSSYKGDDVRVMAIIPVDEESRP